MKSVQLLLTWCCYCRVARVARDREEVAAQQDAAMLAVQGKAAGKSEPSPLAKLDIGLFFKRIVGFLAR